MRSRRDGERSGAGPHPEPASLEPQTLPYCPALLCPPEILGNIFEKSLSYPGYISTPSQPRFNFLSVCRWWYQVAVDTARLWIFLDGNLESWPTFLVRSKSAPLHVYIQQLQNARQLWYASPLYLAIGPAFQLRLETLHIVENWSILSALSGFLLGGCDAEMPLHLVSVKLVTVTVAAARSPRSRIERATIPDSFTSHRFPLLQELELHDCHCDYQAAMFHPSTLKRLSITSLDAVTAPSMDDFLSIIGDNAGLEYLRISPRASEEDQLREIPLLPLLRTLVIEGKASYIEKFLLSFPVSEDLDQATIRLDLVDPVLLMDLEPSFVALHRGIVAKKFRLDSRQASLELDAFSGSEAMEPYLSFTFQQPIHLTLPRIELDIACALVPCGGVTALEIRGDHHPPNECTALLSLMSTVDRLQVFEDCALTLVRVIHPHRTVASAAGTLLLPALKQLWLEDVNFSTIVENQTFFGELSACIHHREQAGAGLESLVLCGCRVLPGDLAELRGMVGEVDVRDGDICLTPEDPVFVITTE